VLLVGLALVTALAVTVNHSLFPTIGILVIGAGLVLPPRKTLVAALVALLLALLVVPAFDIDQPGVRIGNVVMACTLAMLVSIVLTSRVRTIEALREAETAVLASSPDPMMVIAPDGTLVRANPAAAALLPAAVEGRPLHPVLHHLLPDGTRCDGGCLLAGTPPGPEQTGPSCHWLVLDGVRVPFEATAGPLRTGGATVVSLRDVSARVAADEDRRALLAAARRERDLRPAPGRSAPPPVLPGLSFDLACRSTGDEAASGADVVDISVLPDGRVLVLVVDALGHGFVSAPDAWKVLYVARALLHSGTPLQDVVERSAITLAAEPRPPRASVLAAAIDRTSGTVEVAVGGHPPPFLLRSRGTVEWLEAVGGGVGDPRPGSRKVATALLAPGDRLLLFTDGVVDGTHDLVEGLSSLSSAAAARRSLPLAGWAEGLLRLALGTEPVAEDATVLVAQYQGGSPD
jgi:PAS domain-containing protein